MGRTHYQKLFVVLFFVFSLDLSAEQYPHQLTVLVEGATINTGKITTTTGQAIASLYSSADSFLKEPVLTQAMPVNADGEVRFVFSQLKAGKYAVSVFYDENGDGKLNTGLLGIPSERVGVSNNAKGVFGPPSFYKASFEFSESETISIILDRVNK